MRPDDQPALQPTDLGEVLRTIARRASWLAERTRYQEAIVLAHEAAYALQLWQDEQ